MEKFKLKKLLQKMVKLKTLIKDERQIVKKVVKTKMERPYNVFNPRNMNKTQYGNTYNMAGAGNLSDVEYNTQSKFYNTKYSNKNKPMATMYGTGQLTSLGRKTSTSSTNFGFSTMRKTMMKSFDQLDPKYSFLFQRKQQTMGKTKY